MSPPDVYDVEPADWERIAYEATVDAAAHGLRYRELFFTPARHLAAGQGLAGIVAGLTSGIDAAERDTGVRSALVADMDRAFGPVAGRAFVEELVALRRAGKADRVIAVGMDSTELGVDLAAFAEPFALARRNGFRRTGHAGEAVGAGPANIALGLDVLGLERIDHGVAVMEDPELVRRMASERVPLTVCPNSNVIIANRFPSLAEHPFRAMRHAGLLATINTDDPGMTDLDLGVEYRTVAEAQGMPFDGSPRSRLTGSRRRSWTRPTDGRCARSSRQPSPDSDRQSTVTSEPDEHSVTRRRRRGSSRQPRVGSRGTRGLRVTRMDRRRGRVAPWLPVGLVVGLLAGACQPAPPTIAPTVGPATTIAPPATPAGTPNPSAAAVAPALATALGDGIDPDAILADLQRLLDITRRNGGTREAGSEAEAAAAAFIADELRAAGLEVELHSVDVGHFVQDRPSVLEIQAAGAASVFEDLRDYKAMVFSAEGDMTAQVFRLGFDPLAQPGDRGGLGCNAADWVGVPPGVIVLAQPGTCRRHDVVVHAQAAGAVALVTSYAEWERDTVLRPTLVTPGDIHIPVLGTTHAVGLALAQAAEDGTPVHVSVDTTVATRSSVNVIAETPGGDPAHVLMLGGHLDGTIDGPGANDNGSGTMTVLEIARRVAALAADPPATGGPAWKIRVAFFTGEEIGLWGSAAYVRGLSGPDLDAIQAYINLDMLGSPNGLRLVYHGADTSRPIESGSLATLFGRALDRSGLVWQAISLGGSSDHFPFDQAGVPIGGLFSGGSEHKTAGQAELFGGTADAPNDPCLHLACDTLDNIDPELLGELARAAGWVVGALASGEVTLDGS